MTAYVIRRVIIMIPVLIVVSVITFALMHLTPGGPFDQEEGRRQDPVMQARLAASFGMNQPLWQQYFTYIGNVLHGDLGPSFQFRDRNVSDLIRDRLPYSMRLGAQALIFAILVGVPLGIIAALRQNSWVDYLALFLATMGVAVPSFILSLYLILIFAGGLHLVPVAPTIDQYNADLGPWILPTIALGLPSAALMARLTRTSMLEVIRQDYIRTAKAKGLRNSVVIARHMVKNAMIPVWTVLGPLAAALITGSFIVERLFGIPGIGRFFVESIGSRDYSMIMGTTLVYTLFNVMAILIIDLTYGFFDPRIKVNK
jgi:oligopeptide transport system permease protein